MTCQYRSVCSAGECQCKLAVEPFSQTTWEKLKQETQEEREYYASLEED